MPRDDETRSRPESGPATNDTAKPTTAVTVVKVRLQRLNQLERRLLGEECYCERGICASCVALSAIREERRRLEHPSEVVAR